MTRSPLARRGSIYIAVLGVSTMVLVIGLGAVLISRVQARTATAASDFAEARVCARSGLEIAMMAIYSDPYWRRNRGNGAWFTSKAVGTGTFSLSASDPVDNDVTKGNNHPVILTSTGVKGASRYVMSMRMEVGARTGSCLEASLCAAKDVTITSAALTSDQTVRSNTNVVATSAVVNAAVEAFAGVSGSTFNGTTTVVTRASTLPDPTTIMDYYRNNGTAISAGALRPGDRELIANGSFESGISGWRALNGCTLQQNLGALMLKDGLFSLRVTNRDSVTDSVETDLPPADILASHSYALTCPVYSAGAANMRVTFTITTDKGTNTYSTALVAVPANTWTDIKATFPGGAWTGTVSQATLTVESSAATRDFYLDAVSFKDTTYANAYVMDNALLSPTANPYGAANSKGIYNLNCGGRDVVIRDCRVVGTLVLVNPGAGSIVMGSTCMEPAAPNMPSLMTDAAITIALSSAALSEATIGVNLNPSGSPYPYQGGAGTFTNATATDTYPSVITGLVYSKDNLTFAGTTAINGVVIANGAVAVNAASLTLQYSNYYLNNPPPGFTAGTIEMKPVPGTWQRLAN